MLCAPSQFRVIFLALAGALVFVWGGCGDSERFTYATETDEPNYREGQSLLKAGRRQEALTAFLKVIDRRRDDAPESHLEVGLLYVQHINDPLSAIYHFRKYLAQRPNSPQAPLVRQRIDAAIREFARTIPAQPLENQTQRVDLIATLDRLKQENESLKQQLADARASRASSVQVVENTVVATPEVTPSTDNGTVRFSLDTPSSVPTVRTQTNAAPSRSTPGSTVAPVRPSVSTPATPLAGPRRHVVQPGDTLSKLAQQYYNNRAKWRDIYAANRNVMKNESDLRAGMELKIP